VQSCIGRPSKLSAYWAWHESRRCRAGTALLVRHAFKMAATVEGCKVNHTIGNGLDAANDQPAKTFTQDTNDLDYPTGQRKGKDVANLRAILALNGHAVYVLQDDGYLVSKWGYTHHARDIEALRAFAVKLGVLS